jgi:hypothetical protein
MRLVHYEVPCDCCGKVAWKANYQYGTRTALPQPPVALSTFFGLDLCHPCENALKVLYDNLKKERAHGGTP